MANTNPTIGFRVECHNPNLECYNARLLNGSILPRGVPADQTWDNVDAHLSWAHQPTPFVSFFTSWERAIRRRGWLIRSRGATDVVIIAVWLKDKPQVHDALKLATTLGYSDQPLHPRRRLSHHRDEVLVYGGIAAEEHRILAYFWGDSPSTCMVPIDPLPSMELSETSLAEIPADYLAGRHDLNHELSLELRSLCGVITTGCFI
ncbi:hypothetical protein EDB80DRAFT_626490 [Ilyonectria destructans]|nr:hypothetical protein EDB80DRAFT_626490 [Ilyonectria destructans]